MATSVNSNVYTVGEDTVFLLKGVLYLLPVEGSVCEIGCGSGLITEELASHCIEVVATDVTFNATNIAWKRIKRGGLAEHVHIICCDRLEALREGEIFTLITFNPPYLPSEDRDFQYSGGPTGIETPLLFVFSALRRLRINGILLFLLSSLSSWKKALHITRLLGLLPSIIGVKKIGLYEELLLIAAAYPKLS
ncbi:MAG: methyltransferase domain-containing protein [Thermofilaceae archaeon]|nr:methyltransferase domain-containing protein [Thermofilaceae archaeon]